MLVKPGYNSGDVVAYDTRYLHSNEVVHFRNINLHRREAGLIEIDPRDHHFVVMSIFYDKIDQIKKDGSIKNYPYEQYVYVSPVIDEPNHKIFYNSQYLGMMFHFPSYHFKPVNQSDSDLMARYISLMHACPYCDKRISGHTLKNYLVFQCRDNDNGHEYFYKRYFDSQYVVKFKLDIHRAEYDSTTKQYTLDGYVRNKFSSDKTYENLIEIVERVIVFS